MFFQAKSRNNRSLYPTSTINRLQQIFRNSLSMSILKVYFYGVESKALYPKGITLKMSILPHILEKTVVFKM
jgi:hypothetical protein